MLTGSELTTAITAVLIGAVCAGFLLHWFWSNLTSRTDATRLGEMAARLHEADDARGTAESARRSAETRLAQVEAETAEKLAAMQSLVDGVAGDRESALQRNLDETQRELEVMRDGLGHARRRVIELEQENEALTGEKD